MFLHYFQCPTSPKRTPRRHLSPSGSPPLLILATQQVLRSDSGSEILWKRRRSYWTSRLGHLTRPNSKLTEAISLAIWFIIAFEAHFLGLFGPNINLNIFFFEIFDAHLFYI